MTRIDAVAVLTAELHIASARPPLHDEAMVTLPGAGLVREVAWSPDGRRIAFVLQTPIYPVWMVTWGIAGYRYDLYVHIAFRGTPAAAPTGPSMLWVADATGARTRELPTRADTEPSWSPDGRHIVVGGEDGLVIVDAVGGTASQRLTSSVDLWPAWLPTGEIVFARRNGRQPAVCGVHGIWPGEQPRLLLRDCGVAGEIVWAMPT